MFKKIFSVFLSLFGASASSESLDPATIDTLEKAQSLFREGKLEKIYLFPLALGGEDAPENAVYVRLGIAQIKEKLDGTVEKMLDKGQVSQYSAEPQYKGTSVIPCKIHIRAWKQGRIYCFCRSLVINIFSTNLVYLPLLPELAIPHI